MKMTNTHIQAAVVSVLVMGSTSCYSQKADRLDYPATSMEVQTKTYHGETVTDKFSSLTDASSEETKAWAKSQDDFFQGYVNEWSGYEKLKEKVGKLLSVSGRSELPMMAGGRTFFLRDNPERKWDLYVRENGEDKGIFGNEPPFNPRAFYFYIPSPDGKYVAMAMATGHFDWRVLDVSTGTLLEETLLGKDLGGTRLAWSGDSKSFYYMGATNVGEEGKRSGFVVKKHIVGKSAESDKVVFSPESDGSKVELSIDEKGKYLVIEERNGSSTAAKVHYLNTSNGKTSSLIETANASFVFLGNDGDNFFFETDADAARGRVIAIDIKNADKSNWKELVPEQEKSIMGYQSAGGTFLPLMAGDRFVIPYQQDLKQYLRVFSMSGQFEREVELPSGGLYFNTNGLNALSGSRGSEKVLTRFIGITEPNTILEVNAATGEVKPFSRANTNFNAADYTSEIIFSTSKDGTKIPISLTYKKDLEKNGKNPLIMQVYGAIAFTNYPYFQGDFITWLEMGGIHAVAHVRGGGAFGSGWHQDGIARKKQNGIDDYLSALELVASEGYSSSELIVGNGVSAGTIPVAAALTQRPELMGGAVLHYGMMDMISYAERFSKDANHAYMIPDLGTAAVKEDYDALKKYSPYQKLDESVCYPPVLALTSEVDTPLDTDSYRFIAALQNLNSSCRNPYLLQMAWGSGHSAFASRTHSPVLTFSDEVAFLIKALDLDVDDWLMKN